VSRLKKGPTNGIQAEARSRMTAEPIHPNASLTFMASTDRKFPKTLKP